MVPQKKFQLPKVGEAFAFPIGDGRYSVCRVVLDKNSKQLNRSSQEIVLLACSAWIGDQIPRANNPALRPILQLTHHSWEGEPELLWVADEPPADLIPIGLIKPTAKEQSISCDSYGTWSLLMVQPLKQWRWDHERESVLKEDALAEKKQKVIRKNEIQNKLPQEPAKKLEHITLEQLKKHRFFPNWKDYVSAKIIRASRKIMTQTVEDLIKLGPTATKPKRKAVLKKCIESFNDLDDEEEFIDTIAREDICEEFDTIANACGLGDLEELADKWRDW